MEFHVITCMELQGTTWHSMELHEYSMELHGYSMQLLGTPWKFHGIPWRYFTRVAPNRDTEESRLSCNFSPLRSGDHIYDKSCMNHAKSIYHIS